MKDQPRFFLAHETLTLSLNSLTFKFETKFYIFKSSLPFLSCKRKGWALHSFTAPFDPRRALLPKSDTVLQPCSKAVFQLNSG